MKCPQCPYYERTTSYGVEWFKCNNKECPYNKAEIEEEKADE